MASACWATPCNVGPGSRPPGRVAGQPWCGPWAATRAHVEWAPPGCRWGDGSAVRPLGKPRRPRRELTLKPARGRRDPRICPDSDFAVCAVFRNPVAHGVPCSRRPEADAAGNPLLCIVHPMRHCTGAPIGRMCVWCVCGVRHTHHTHTGRMEAIRGAWAAGRVLPHTWVLGRRPGRKAALCCSRPTAERRAAAAEDTRPMVFPATRVCLGPWRVRGTGWRDAP